MRGVFLLQKSFCSLFERLLGFVRMFLFRRILLSISVSVVTLALTALPQIATAHERQAFTIGQNTYLITIGSLNEPVVVDDKTGLDLRVTQVNPQTPGDRTTTDAKPVEGLETTLKVELIAGAHRKILAITPAYKDPGAYRASFIPTLETTFAYRLFGTLNNTPVDLTFTCAASEAGHAAGEDASAQQMSEGVTRIFKAGGFSCPGSKAALAFPSPIKTDAEMYDALNGSTPIKSASTSSLISYTALAVALIALAVAKRRNLK